MVIKGGSKKFFLLVLALKIKWPLLRIGVQASLKMVGSYAEENNG